MLALNCLCAPISAVSGLSLCVSHVAYPCSYVGYVSRMFSIRPVLDRMR